MPGHEHLVIGDVRVVGDVPVHGVEKSFEQRGVVVVLDQFEESGPDVAPERVVGIAVYFCRARRNNLAVRQKCDCEDELVTSANG